MSITNTQLADAVSDLIASWQTFMDEHRAWLGGVVGGGPNSDGKYPLTDDLDVTVLVKAPAQLQADVTGMVSSASAYATAASASATAAAASATTASTQAGNAASSASAASTSASTASTQASNAASSATTASGQATAAAASATAAAASAAQAQAAAGALTDPNAHSVMTWNDTTNLPVWVTAGTALSVLGRSANSVGVPAAISGANNQVLGITGSVLGFVSTLPAVSGVNLTALPTGLSTTFTGNNIFNPATGAPIDLRTSAAVPAYAIFRPNGTARGYVGCPGATNDLITGSAVGDLVLRAESGRFLWSPDGGTTLVNVTPTSGSFTATLTGMTGSDDRDGLLPHHQQHRYVVRVRRLTGDFEHYGAHHDRPPRRDPADHDPCRAVLVGR
jgi:hypothetical protein